MCSAGRRSARKDDASPCSATCLSSGRKGARSIARCFDAVLANASRPGIRCGPLMQALWQALPAAAAAAMQRTLPRLKRRCLRRDPRWRRPSWSRARSARAWRPRQGAATGLSAPGFRTKHNRGASPARPHKVDAIALLAGPICPDKLSVLNVFRYSRFAPAAPLSRAVVRFCSARP